MANDEYVKSLPIKEGTRVLFNKAKAKYVEQNPKTDNISADSVLNYILKKYLQV